MFIGMLGHDLRNLLSALQTGAQIIDQLLDYTTARSPRGIPVVAAPANLVEVCREVIAELEEANPGRTIALSVSGDGQGSWDADRIAQVFSNLIGNAISYGHPERPVDVTLNAEGDSIRFEVRNHGRPIAPTALPFIFDPFRRATQQKASATTGLGLGLYISKEIVGAHGGTISVTSSEAEGTALRLALPRHASKVQ